MQMLGFEATLGASLTFSLMCVAMLLPGEDAGHLENMAQASLQMVHSPTVLFSVWQHGRSVCSAWPLAAATRRPRGPHCWPRAWASPVRVDPRGEDLRRVDGTDRRQRLLRRSDGVPRPAPIANAAAFGRPGADDGARAAVLQRSRRVHHEAAERHAPRVRRRHPAGGRVDACAARGVGGVLAGRARCREHGPVWPAASEAQPPDWPRLAEAGRGSGQPHTRRCWPISSQSSGAAGGRLRRAS